MHNNRNTQANLTETSRDAKYQKNPSQIDIAKLTKLSYRLRECKIHREVRVELYNFQVLTDRRLKFSEQSQPMPSVDYSLNLLKSFSKFTTWLQYNRQLHIIPGALFSTMQN